MNRKEHSRHEESRPIAFFAIWTNKPSEYHASPEEEEETSARIKQAFHNARARGIRMYGRYGCRWSTSWQYFTFWHCPSLGALEETIGELEQAGDFKFADSQHIIGVPMEDVDMIDLDYLRSGGPDPERPIGFFALWRQTDSYYRASAENWETSDQTIRRVFDYARSQGVQMLGRYDCRWSTEWDYFTFWQVPSLEVLDAIIARLEPAGDFWFADSRHVIGNLEPHFRFARHMRVDATRAEGGY